MRIFVTGIGIFTSIGKNSTETLHSIETGHSGIGYAQYLKTNLKDILPVAEIKHSNEELALMAGVENVQHFTRTALLAIFAARQSVQDAGLSVEELSKAGLVSATSVGGMDKSENFYPEFISNPDKGRLRNIVHHDCGDSTEAIARELGLKQFLTTISTACSSSANSIMLGARLIKNGYVDRVLAGGADSLTRFTMNGFNSLMILDKNHCKPFDENRNGLNLGEGAAYLVLESEESAIKNNRKIYCELKGYGNACDAFHQTASSPDGYGAWLAMKKALDTAHLSPEEISYINVHGTGTQNNDLSEGKAVEKLFGDAIPPLSSTKAFTGHTLGAAGAVEAVLASLAITNGLIYPNLNFSEKMKELNFLPNIKLIKNATVNHVLSNSFGFGGNNSTLIFSRS